jgi:hypothetical protein
MRSTVHLSVVDLRAKDQSGADERAPVAWMSEVPEPWTALVAWMVTEDWIAA